MGKESFVVVVRLMADVAEDVQLDRCTNVTVNNGPEKGKKGTICLCSEDFCNN